MDIKITSMKKLLFLFIILLSSCYSHSLYDPEYEAPTDEWLCYVNPDISDADEIQIVGDILYRNIASSINRRCSVTNDSILFVSKNVYNTRDVYLDALLIKVKDGESLYEKAFSIHKYKLIPYRK